MQSIKIIFRDNSLREFKHEGRAGGSYTKTVEYKSGFVIITDEWGKTVAFPQALVAEVQCDPGRSW